jgi:hypothetical protein
MGIDQAWRRVAVSTMRVVVVVAALDALFGRAHLGGSLMRRLMRELLLRGLSLFLSRN